MDLSPNKVTVSESVNNVSSLADTKLQDLSESRVLKLANNKDSFCSPISVLVIPPHEDDVLRSLTEEWKNVKERMALLRDEVAKVKQKDSVVLVLDIENESNKLFQALDCLKRQDYFFSEIQKPCQQSVDSLLDAFSRANKAIQQYRQGFKKFLPQLTFRDKLVESIVVFGFVLVIACVVLCMSRLSGLGPSTFILVGVLGLFFLSLYGCPA